MCNILRKAMECSIVSKSPDMMVILSPSGEEYVIDRTKPSMSCSCPGFRYVGRCAHWMLAVIDYGYEQARNDGIIAAPPLAA